MKDVNSSAWAGTQRWTQDFQFPDKQIYSGFLALRILVEDTYRVGAAMGVRGIRIAKFEQPDTEIAPLHVGRIPCELPFVSEYRLRPGLYVLQIGTSLPRAQLLAVPAETEMMATWDR